MAVRRANHYTKQGYDHLAKYYWKFTTRVLAAYCLVLELKEKNYILNWGLNSALQLYVLAQSYPEQVPIHDKIRPL